MCIYVDQIKECIGFFTVSKIDRTLDASFEIRTCDSFVLVIFTVFRFRCFEIFVYTGVVFCIFYIVLIFKLVYNIN